ncbi:MAG: hypothetical protein LBT01_05050 [Spirochaetaceae bacterium]|jgi:predicted aldo/keto reductase-like oxidoreductase|nr:hypothetical protein [Spirochaetaceae bacterium]
MEEIVEIVQGGRKFSEDDAREVEKYRAELGPSWCHRCDYCQPCPQGIAISTVLSSKSISGGTGVMSFRYICQFA